MPAPRKSNRSAAFFKLAVGCCLLGFTLLSAASLASAAESKSPATTTSADATLKGLTAVRVTIDLSEAVAEKHGLRKADLQARLEGKLKKAGLQILGESERAQGMPTLYLNLGLLALDKSSASTYVYSIDMELIQEVRLLRAPGTKAASPTWRAPGSLGTIEAAELPSLRDTADELGEKFLAAYRAANVK